MGVGGRGTEEGHSSFLFLRVGQGFQSLIERGPVSWVILPERSSTGLVPTSPLGDPRPLSLKLCRKDFM